MDKIIQYSDEMETRELFRLIKEGYEFTCPKCKTKLEIVLKSNESSKVPLNVSCPVNMNHVYTTFTYDRKSFWDGFKEEVEELKKNQTNNKSRF